ncbi:hypothetical protein DFS34DRAFT_570606, partial [Phlyctochytrium arcticum]
SSAPSTPTPQTPTPKRNRPTPCSLSCGAPAVKIVGDCRWCQSKFCAKHRLPEAHQCPGMEGCKKYAVGHLEKRLLGEKCVGSKV